MSSIPKKPSHHLSAYERRKLYEAIKFNNSTIAELAVSLKRDKSTLYKELKRNGALPPRLYQDTKKKKQLLYDDINAQESYESWWLKSHIKKRIANSELQDSIVTRLTLGHTPKQIAGRLAFLKGESVVCHETIYQWIYKDRKDLGKYLYSKRKKRVPYTPKPSHSIAIPHRTPLSQRAEHEDMNELGHWEADLVGSSSKATVLVLTEKHSRYTLYHHIPNKTSHTVKYGILFLYRSFSQDMVKSITYDNGKEHVLHHEINKRLECRSYFCEPYRGWEKGQVEYAIRLFRRFFPKKTNFDTIKYEACIKAQHILNNRPRECLGFRTPAECFAAEWT